MLIVDSLEQSDKVLAAWKCIHVDDIVLLDSTCFHRLSKERPHIPMRFMFENLSDRHRAMHRHHCWDWRPTRRRAAMLVQAESVLGDLDAAENAAFAAWPLPITKGFTKHPQGKVCDQ
jgi:hypothetical protein